MTRNGKRQAVKDRRHENCKLTPWKKISETGLFTTGYSGSVSNRNIEKKSLDRKEVGKGENWVRKRSMRSRNLASKARPRSAMAHLRRRAGPAVVAS